MEGTSVEDGVRGRVSPPCWGRGLRREQCPRSVAVAPYATGLSYDATGAKYIRCSDFCPQEIVPGAKRTKKQPKKLAGATQSRKKGSQKPQRPSTPPKNASRGAADEDSVNNGGPAATLKANVGKKQQRFRRVSKNEVDSSMNPPNATDADSAGAAASNTTVSFPGVVRAVLSASRWRKLRAKAKRLSAEETVQQTQLDAASVPVPRVRIRTR